MSKVDVVRGALEWLTERLRAAPLSQYATLAAETEDGARPLVMSPDEAKQIAEARMILRRRNLADLLEKGKLMNMHDIPDDRRGPDYVNSRSRLEDRAFGGRDVHYGHLTKDPFGSTYRAGVDWSRKVVEPNDLLQAYGGFGVEPRPELRGRSTFTLGDSLDEMRGPYSSADLLHASSKVPYQDASVPNSRLRRLAAEHQENHKDKTFMEFLREQGLPSVNDHVPRLLVRPLADPASVPLLPSERYTINQDLRDLLDRRLKTAFGYVETQTHGNIFPEDIATIHDYRPTPSSALEKKLRKLGINYSPMPAEHPIRQAAEGKIRTYQELREALGALPGVPVMPPLLARLTPV